MKKLFEKPNFELLYLEAANMITTDGVIDGSIPSEHDPNELPVY